MPPSGWVEFQILLENFEFGLVSLHALVDNSPDNMATNEVNCLDGTEVRLNQYRRGACAIFCAPNRAIGENLALERTCEMLARQWRGCRAEDVRLVVGERTLWNQLLLSCGRVERRELKRTSRLNIKEYRVIYSANIDKIRPLMPQEAAAIVDSWWQQRSPPKRAIGSLSPVSATADKRQRSGSNSDNAPAGTVESLSAELHGDTDLVAEPEVVVEAQPPTDQRLHDASRGEVPTPAASEDVDTPGSDGSHWQRETPAGNSDDPLPDIDRHFFDELVLFATSCLAKWRRMDAASQTRAMSTLFSLMKVEERIRVLAAWSLEREAFVRVEALSDIFMNEIKQYAQHTPRSFAGYINASTGAFDEFGLGDAAGVSRCESHCPVLFRILEELTRSEHQRQHGSNNQNAIGARTLALVDIIGHSRFFGQVAFPTVARTGFLLKWGGTSQEVIGILSRLRLTCSESTAERLLNAAAKRHVAFVRKQIHEWSVNCHVPLVAVDNWNPLSWPKHPKVNQTFTRCSKSMTVIAKALEGELRGDVPAAANAPLDLALCADVLHRFNTWKLPRDLQLPRDNNRHVTTHTFTFLPSLPVSSSTFTDHVKTLTGSLLGQVFRCDSKEVVVLADPEPLLLFHRQTFVSHHEDNIDHSRWWWATMARAPKHAKHGKSPASSDTPHENFFSNRAKTCINAKDLVPNSVLALRKWCGNVSTARGRVVLVCFACLSPDASCTSSAVSSVAACSIDESQKHHTPPTANILRLGVSDLHFDHHTAAHIPVNRRKNDDLRSD